MIEHLVLFRFNERITKDKENELLTKLLGFKAKIPGIVHITAGINSTKELENQHGFTIGLRVTFQDEEALQQYGPHPVHQDFVQSLSGFLEQVIVVDYPIADS
jgi:hypothetical protein